jgi:hypothetical protein
MTTIDYDAPGRSVVEAEEASIEELKARSTSTQSPMADLDEPDAIEGFELPGTELTIDEPIISVVVPMLADEFRCSCCFLVCHRSQRALGQSSQAVCRECA